MRATIIALLTIVFAVSSVNAGIYLREETGVAGLMLGNCLSRLDDQDGDGTTEMLVGAPGYQGAGADAGGVLLWFGGNQFSLTADQIWIGSPPERFGHAVSRIGDVNGDGVGDWAVGAPMANNAGAEAGRVYVFYGADPLPTTPDLVLEGPTAGIRFGWSVAALGDLNGDGRDDFIVGAPYANSPSIQGGAAYVFYGRNGDPHTTPDLTLAGTVAYEHFGWSVAGVGAFLGGNARCAAVGAPSYDTGSSAIQGSVYVFQGTTSAIPGPDATADLVLRSSATAVANNEFGFSVAGVGSYDGDSDPDIAVGIPAYSGAGIDRGRVEIFFGGFDADDQSDREVDGPSSNSGFGWSVALIGDVTHTSLEDVLIGAPYDDVAASNAGRAFILPGGYGDVGDADSLPEVDRGELVVGTAANDHFGFWCAGLGDLDGDGEPDYAVAAPQGNVATLAVAGWVRVIDSSGEAVPVILGDWRCRWTDTGAVCGTMVVSVPDVEVVHARLERLGTPNVVLHDGPPASGTAVSISNGLLSIEDAAAPTDPVYSLQVRLLEGTVVTQTPLIGPAGRPPRSTLELAPARPNPFNPRTVLSYRAVAGTPLSLRVFDLRGRLIRTLVTATASGAWQTAAWDGHDQDGRAIPAGVYMARLEAGMSIRHQSLLLVE